MSFYKVKCHCEKSIVIPFNIDGQSFCDPEETTPVELECPFCDDLIAFEVKGEIKKSGMFLSKRKVKKDENGI